MRAAKNEGGGATIPPPATRPLITRRPVLTGLVGSLTLRALPVLAHDAVGPVNPPIEVPDIHVVSSDGFSGRLRERLIGRVTAIQLMFTKCKSICPIEAATFVRVQEALGGCPCGDIQLLSLSIDPLTDTPDVLKAWLDGLGAGRGWTAVSPARADLERTRQFFDRASSAGENHSTAMDLINRSGRLTWRTSELPAPNEVVKVLSYLQRSASAALP